MVWAWIIGIIATFFVILIIFIMYQRRKNSSNDGIISRINKIERGACKKLLEKLFGC